MILNVWCLEVLQWDLFFFLVYINDLHVAINYYEMCHFSDNTNLLNFNSLVKSINKQVKYDLQNLANCFKVNKFPLMFVKTELVLFTSPRK